MRGNRSSSSGFPPRLPSGDPLSGAPVPLKSSSLLAFALLVAVLVALVSLKAVFAVEPIGIAIQVLAVLLMIWARATFGVRSLHAAANPTGGGLVTSGPYRFLRHPIYAAVL